MKAEILWEMGLVPGRLVNHVKNVSLVVDHTGKNKEKEEPSSPNHECRVKSAWRIPNRLLWT